MSAAGRGGGDKVEERCEEVRDQLGLGLGGTRVRRSRRRRRRSLPPFAGHSGLRGRGRRLPLVTKGSTVRVRTRPPGQPGEAVGSRRKAQGAAGATPRHRRLAPAPYVAVSQYLASIPQACRRPGVPWYTARGPTGCRSAPRCLAALERGARFAAHQARYVRAGRASPAWFREVPSELSPTLTRRYPRYTAGLGLARRNNQTWNAGR
jgi:hypothetical protein